MKYLLLAIAVLTACGTRALPSRLGTWLNTDDGVWELECAQNGKVVGSVRSFYGTQWEARAPGYWENGDVHMLDSTYIGRDMAMQAVEKHVTKGQLCMKED